MQEKKYFPGLDALRFFAAVAIIIHHIEQLKSLFRIPSFWESVIIKELGRKGIMFFLVLSGFLVTYKLLHEMENNHKIDLQKFYFKRRLRIWPLYLFVVFWSFFIFSHFLPLDIFNKSGTENSFYLKLFGFSLMAPNFMLILFSPVWGISQAWVIGVEEQFYIFWPKLTEKFYKHFIPLCIFLIASKYALDQFILSVQDQIPILLFFGRFLHGEVGFYFEYIVIGGMGAYYLIFDNARVLNFFYSKPVQFFALAFFILYLTPYKTLLFFLPFYHHIHQFLISVGLPFFLMIIILNVAKNNKSIIKPYNNLLNSLGRISYGIYMYHVTIIFLVIRFLIFIGVKKDIIVFNSLLYPISILLTIAISKLSYNHFELFFLKKAR